MSEEFYGYWKVLDKTPKDIGYPRKDYWFVQCVCSRKHYVRMDDLKKGKSKSCGCSKSRKLFKDIGKKFHKWTVLELGGIINTHRMAKCVCECGWVANLRLSSIKNGYSKSCSIHCTRNHDA